MWTSSFALTVKLRWPIGARIDQGESEADSVSEILSGYGVAQQSGSAVGSGAQGGDGSSCEWTS
jgi:hypothetical protein